MPSSLVGLLLLLVMGAATEAAAAEETPWFTIDLQPGAPKSRFEWLKPDLVEDRLAPKREQPTFVAPDPVHPTLRTLVDDEGGRQQQITVWLRLAFADMKGPGESCGADWPGCRVFDSGGMERLDEVSELQACLLQTTPARLEPLIREIDLRRHGEVERSQVNDDEIPMLPGNVRVLSLEPDRFQQHLLRAEKDGNCTPRDLDEVSVARRLINADYLAALPNSVNVALLDSGIIHGTPFFDLVAERLDCAGCSTPGRSSPRSLCCGKVLGTDDWHGTKSASILVASGLQDHLGDHYQGLLDSPIRSYRIAKAGSTGTWETIHGIQAALLNGDSVLLVEVAHEAVGKHQVLAAAANCAFDHGAVVVAPIGNESGHKTLAIPGLAEKVLGIGAIDIEAPKEIDAKASGPTVDGRIKPDLLAPSFTEVVYKQRHGAPRCGEHRSTSGAAPYAAAAAALLKNLVVSEFPPESLGGISDEPGLIYALMILSGQHPYDCETSQYQGAGLIRLPSQGVLTFGRVDLEAKDVVKIPVAGVEPGWTLDGALWWPESEFQHHSDLDLGFFNGEGGETATGSRSSGSVFERAREVAGPQSTGDWSLRISAYSVGPGLETQRAYWAALASPPGVVEPPISPRCPLK